MKKIKSTIKNMLKGLRIGIYRIPKGGACCGTQISNPVLYNSAEGMQEFYLNSKNIKQYITPERLLYFRSLLDFCSKKLNFTDKDIADLGCGTGHFLKLLGETFKPRSLSGYELCEASVKLAKSVCPQADVKQFDIYDPALSQFDIIFCMEVLEHLLRPELALKSCLKYMRNNACLVLVVPNGRKDFALEHINFWSPESWKAFIESNCDGMAIETGILGESSNYAIIRKNDGRN